MDNPRVLVRRIPASDPVVATPAIGRRPPVAVDPKVASLSVKPEQMREMARDFTPTQGFALRISEMESEYEQFKGWLQIDRNDLDTMQAEQASLYLEVCERYTMSCSVRDQARDVLARKDAELARNERYNLSQNGGKVTEGIINDFVMLHQEHINASEDYEICKRIADKWSGMEKSFQQRKSMLQELTGLFASGYWNTGSVKPRATVRDALAKGIKGAQAEQRARRS